MNTKLSVLSTLIFAPLILSASIRSYNISIENKFDYDRIDEPISLNICNLTDFFPTSAVVTNGDVEIPCQLDDINNDGMNDEIAFVIDVEKKSTLNLNLTLTDEQPQKEYEPRVWAGFMLVGRKKGQTVDVTEVTVPGHTDFYNMVHGHGPMFESELVGYRVYFNQKQTLDPYGKFNKGLELADTKFYPTDEHISKGYGDDVLMAGNSCGIGAFKGWDGTKATHIEPVATRTERLVANGPVRTIVEVEVKDWQYKGDKINMLNRYTLYAGHRDLQIDVEMGCDINDKTFATGVERIMGDETTCWRDHKGLVASWGRHYPVTDTVKFAKETIGIATFVPEKNVVADAEDSDNFLYIVQIPPEDNSCMTYYTMFTSKKETFGYDDQEAWYASLPSWRHRLENPLEITLKNATDVKP